MNVVHLAVIVLVQILLVFYYIVSVVYFKDDFLNIIGIPIYLIIVVLLNVLSLYMLAKYYKRQEKQKVFDTEYTHIEEFRSLVASVRSDRHDVNNHLTVISGLMKLKNYEVADNYIKEMIGEIRITNQVLTIKNPILASMLYSKMDKYKKEDIPFELNIANEEIVQVLSSTDLIRLLGNLLDNAYEATYELPNKERIIKLDTFLLDKKIILIVKNTSKAKEFKEDYFEVGYSSKSTSGDRGYGLAIIRDITEKYSGSLQIETKNNLVCFQISLPMMKET
ncbi:MAG: sensor histidine kinase [Anaerobacillus sp.]|uniref:sensor histidine kinase n=1 Tax=Anaerobacillus sp. TaxID=1872506 RepID=UPI00391C9241